MGDVTDREKYVWLDRPRRTRLTTRVILCELHSPRHADVPTPDDFSPWSEPLTAEYQDHQLLKCDTMEFGGQVQLSTHEDSFDLGSAREGKVKPM